MDEHVERSAEVLARTPGALTGLLGGLSDAWARSNYGPETFSPFDVVGHLIHAEETNWMTRARMILAEGQGRPFPAFDRFAMYEASRGKSMAYLLESFAAARAKNLADLLALNLTGAQLELRGTHPDLGSVTLRQLLSTWVVHDLAHLAQITKAMGYQYRSEVGPWAKFFSILPKPAAH
ncbi:MAG: DinB family protein [Planctomycetota bacterium]|nr:DinB family protein [Planctomycetota bacterium]